MNRIESAAQSAWQAFKNSQRAPLPPVEDAETLLAQISRRDWQHVIDTIINAGMPLREIARRLGLRHRAVQHWREDPRAEPKDSHARKLMVLYRRATSG